MKEGHELTTAAEAGRKRLPYRRRRRVGPRVDASGPVLAAIDVGTNACRLLIAVPPNGVGGGLPRVIDSYTASVRLGEGLETTGALTEAAIDRVVAALIICAERLKRRGATHVSAIATEACRRASNTQVLLDRALNEAGIRLVVVSPEEEARLAAEGAMPLLGDGFDGALIFDIGGGSTEMILVRAAKDAAPEILAWASAPVGVVALAERHGHSNLAASTYGAMRESLRESFAALTRQLTPADFNPERYHLLGTSGTLTTLAGVKLGLTRYNRSRIDGLWLERKDVLEILETISTRDFAGRADIPCIGADRADLILPGCAILSTIMDNWRFEHLRVADRGLREGLLIGLMREAKTIPQRKPGRHRRRGRAKSSAHGT